MRIRISYKMNDKDILEEGQIKNFPPDLWGRMAVVVYSDNRSAYDRSFQL